VGRGGAGPGRGARRRAGRPPAPRCGRQPRVQQRRQRRGPIACGCCRQHLAQPRRRWRRRRGWAVPRRWRWCAAPTVPEPSGLLPQRRLAARAAARLAGTTAGPAGSWDRERRVRDPADGLAHGPPAWTAADGRT